jgi:hypothetical protein
MFSNHYLRIIRQFVPPIVFDIKRHFAVRSRLKAITDSSQPNPKTHVAKEGSSFHWPEEDLAFLRELRQKKMKFFFESEEIIDSFVNDMEENFVRFEPRTPEPGNWKYVNALVQDGVTRVENFLTKEQTDDLVGYLKPRAEAFHQELVEQCGPVDACSSYRWISLPADKNVQFDSLGGIMRVRGIENYYSAIRDCFINDPRVEDIAQSYLGGMAVRKEAYLDYKCVQYSRDPNLVPHMDKPFRCLKFFLPLQDVTDENGPFTYYKGTHRIRDWRMLNDLAYYAGLNRRYGQHCHDKFSLLALSRIEAEYPEEVAMETFPVKAGDLIIADVRGIHAGESLRKGTRLQLVHPVEMLGNFREAGQKVPLHLKETVRNF